MCDFTGTHPQLSNSLNCSRAGLESACRVIYKSIIGHSAPLSEGTFERLQVVCPPGTVFTCERPAATSIYWEVLVRCTDLVWKALAPLVPDRVTAGHFVSICADLITGIHPESGELFILFEPNCGGWGAGVGQDGQRGLVSIGDGETFMIPVEVAEMKYGVVVDQYAFNVTGAGAGRWRGGEGIVRDYRLTAEVGTVTATCGRHEFPPWGVAGGADGSSNELQFIYSDSKPTRRVGMISRQPIERGDVVRILTGTGGGWGSPLERDPGLVAADVRNGFVTIDDAREVYGVLVDPGWPRGRRSDLREIIDRYGDDLMIGKTRCESFPVSWKHGLSGDHRLGIEKVVLGSGVRVPLVARKPAARDLDPDPMARQKRIGRCIQPETKDVRFPGLHQLRFGERVAKARPQSAVAEEATGAVGRTSTRRACQSVSSADEAAQSEIVIGPTTSTRSVSSAVV